MTRTEAGVLIDKASKVMITKKARQYGLKEDDDEAITLGRCAMLGFLKSLTLFALIGDTAEDLERRLRDLIKEA